MKSSGGRGAKGEGADAVIGNALDAEAPAVEKFDGEIAGF
jgi:hypothetical protein